MIKSHNFSDRDNRDRRPVQKVSDCYVFIFRPLQSGNQGHADNLSLPKRILKISKVKTSERLQVRLG